MHPHHLPLLVCPRSLKPLSLLDAEYGGERVQSGRLVESDSGHEYPIRNFIPRFVPAENYAGSFGFQWNLFKKTQADSFSGKNISAERFAKETRWGDQLGGQLLLEAGSGAGRFTPHALGTGATIVSFDFSHAVDANYELNGAHPNLLLVQASLYEMPFARESFDKAFCFGVLQHTPDPQKSFLALPPMLKSGGKLATDIYLSTWLNALHVKYYMRLFTAGRDPERLFNFTRKYVGFWWPLAKLVRGNRVGQKAISRLIAERSNYLDADDATQREWADLDTFDWFSPAYDQPQTVAGFRRWHEEAGLSDIDVHRGYNGVEARATKG